MVGCHSSAGHRSSALLQAWPALAVVSEAEGVTGKHKDKSSGSSSDDWRERHALCELFGG